MKSHYCRDRCTVIRESRSAAVRREAIKCLLLSQREKGEHFCAVTVTLGAFSDYSHVMAYESSVM